MSDLYPKHKSPIWGGRFTQSPADSMQKINASIAYDKTLYRQDIEGSKAHATMLCAVGILSTKECAAILQGLEDIAHEIENDAFPFSDALEDIHMNIEARLVARIGAAGKKLHTARSRNDQVATDLRLWMRGAIDDLNQQITMLQTALINKADAHCETLMPGYTHLQTAQPISFGFHLMAYVEMLQRDKTRLIDCQKRLNESPLGAAALAGTSHPIDRHMTAEYLGFEKPMANALDSVSARDFAVEFLSAAAICATHLSRLAEEIVLWSTDRFHFIQLSDAFTTGSSIMPQKRNPDAAELVRAKPGRIIGDLTALLIVLKGVPLAYGKDMQEDKEPIFDAQNTLTLSLAVMTGMIDDMHIHADHMRAALKYGHPTATDCADFLVAQGMAFRDAHHVTGELVGLADAHHKGLEELSLEQIQTLLPEMDERIFDVLAIDKAVAMRQSYGGTAPQQVKNHIALARANYLKTCQKAS